MSPPYQRGDTSPETPSYYSDSSSPRTLSPPWKSSKRRGFPFDLRRIASIFGAFIGLGVVILLIRSGTSKPNAVEELSRKGTSHRNHFVDFEGGLDCRMSSLELYEPPGHDTPQTKKKYPYCKTRENLLEALGGGGRHGFDAPYFPKGCHYKWYTGLEICMILDRFDGIVFLGDDMVHHIYSAFNVLLRQDLALGGLQQWKMTDKERDGCRCSNQFTKPECNKYFVGSSEEVALKDNEGGAYRAPYICNRAPHFYLSVRGTPAAPEDKFRYSQLLNSDPHSWKPIATIHSLGLSTSFQWQTATESLDEWLTIADESGRNSPFLWLGPNAAGHLKPPTKIMQEGNNALWHYNVEMGKEAGRRGVEHLRLWNLTLQAGSWDGSHFGERVAVVEAMMIINWLARLEST